MRVILPEALISLAKKYITPYPKQARLIFTIYSAILRKVIMKILFLVPYPKGVAPSQRFRFEQYLDIVGHRNWSYRYQSFFSLSDWQNLYTTGHLLRKIFTLAKGYAKRFFILFNMQGVPIVFIHRELAPFGPPFFEWVIAKVLRKKIIYDFDDAIWLTDKQEGRVEKVLRWRSKVKPICRWSYRVSCGNEYLAAYAKKFNARVTVNPTTIDTESVHDPALFPNNPITDKVVIGWTGSHSTLKYLELIVPVIQKLQALFATVDFLVIANQKPNLNLSRLTFIKWKKETEAADLSRIDIGVMPLPDDEWTRGKCGFKALQYMAMQIPCVASPVGVNTKIIDHGRNGFLATQEAEWFACLEQLIRNPSLRQTLGKAGREKVTAHYSVASNTDRFLSLFV